MTDDESYDLTDPVDVAALAFDHSDGVIIGDVATIQSYVDRDADGNLIVDVYSSNLHLEGGGTFRYRIEHVGPAPEPPTS
ncbi:hypothetical protein FFT09_22595 [Saccharomonospora piscinae]|uniref:hypothetical protein n=1 Tax=Saccharomonospora piscinae TaxID=687388 RepID=UPI0011066A03|nr:hypothetical protein [Saccharomonospora piscinae]TLW89223.1 hypothetical protein FFT09_22595 [Saccharomonospora piscinae]